MTKAIILTLLLLFNLTVFSQTNAELIKLNSKSRTTIVMKVSQLLLNNYVNKETAIKMSTYIKQRQKEGAYNTITDPVAFSDLLSNDLYSIYHDGHLSVQYNPALELQLLDTSAIESIINNDPLRRNIQANFGLTKVEVLNGNIGYLNLTHFWADKIYGKETVKAALKFVANTNALIIDLRTNGGGSPETVTMICSYFF